MLVKIEKHQLETSKMIRTYKLSGMHLFALLMVLWQLTRVFQMCSVFYYETSNSSLFCWAHFIQDIPSVIMSLTIIR